MQLGPRFHNAIVSPKHVGVNGVGRTELSAQGNDVANGAGVAGASIGDGYLVLRKFIGGVHFDGNVLCAASRSRPTMNKFGGSGGVLHLSHGPCVAAGEPHAKCKNWDEESRH